MKEIVAEYGWPVERMVGRDGAHLAWLLVQHADRDVTFQRRCLALMEPHAQNRQVSQADIAYLTDRVLVNEGKKQIYGTQFHTVDGKLKPRPIQEPEAVDQRRKNMGLSTLQEYTEFMHT